MKFLKVRELQGILTSVRDFCIFNQKSGNFEKQVYEVPKVSRIMDKVFSSCFEFII